MTDAVVRHTPAGATRAARLALFVVAAAIGAFELGSLLYLKRASVDFVVARRLAEAPAIAMGTVVSWRGQTPGLLAGWSRPEPHGTWSSAPTATIALRLADRAPGDLLLGVTAVAFVDAERLPTRGVDVVVNGAPVAHWRFDSREAVARVARIPHGLVAADGLVRIDFHFPERLSPRAAHGGDDARQLGILLVEWRLDPAP